MSKHWLLYPSIHPTSCRVAKSVRRGSVSLISTSYGLALNRPLIDLWFHIAQHNQAILSQMSKTLLFQTFWGFTAEITSASLTNCIFCSPLIFILPYINTNRVPVSFDVQMKKNSINSLKVTSFYFSEHYLVCPSGSWGWAKRAGARTKLSSACFIFLL